MLLNNHLRVRFLRQIKTAKEERGGAWYPLGHKQRHAAQPILKTYAARAEKPHSPTSSSQRTAPHTSHP